MRVCKVVTDMRRLCIHVEAEEVHDNGDFNGGEPKVFAVFLPTEEDTVFMATHAVDGVNPARATLETKTNKITLLYAETDEYNNPLPLSESNATVKTMVQTDLDYIETFIETRVKHKERIQGSVITV